MKEKLEEKSKIIKTSKEYKRTIIEEKDKEWTKKLNDILSRSSFSNDELDKIKALIPKEILTNENVGLIFLLAYGASFRISFIKFTSKSYSLFKVNNDLNTSSYSGLAYPSSLIDSH